MKTNTGRSPAGIVLFLMTLPLAGCLEEAVDDPAIEAPDPGPGTNNAPSISGSPGDAVTAGDMYGFVPQASDPDGDTLQFSAQNLPRWADLNPATGELVGQPLLGDIGVYDNIVLSVSDGTASDSLAPFSVTVSQAALGSMSLSWTPPTLNTDGTSLQDLSGYNIYYGLSAGSYPNRVEVRNPSISTYVVDNLLPNTYYVVATSVNAMGIESEYSNVAIKVVSSQ